MPETRYRTVLELALDDRNAGAGVKRLSSKLDDLGKSVEEAFAGSALAELNKTLDRTAKLMEGIAKQQEKASRAGRSGGAAGTVAGALTGMALGQGRGLIGALDAHAGAGLHGDYGAGGRMAGGAWLAGRAGGRFADRAATTIGNYGGMMMNEGFVGQMLAGVPWIGPIFGGAASAAGGYYSSGVARSRARAGAFGATGLSASDIGSFGNPYGLGPTELPQVLAQYAQAAGARGRDEIGMGFGTAADLSNLLGIDYGATGGFQRAMGMTALGGRPGGRDRAGEIFAVQDTLASALAAGVEQSQLGQVLENLSSTFEDLQTRGMLIDPSSLNSLVRGFGALGAEAGFGGMAGVRAATGMTESLRGVGQRENLFEMLALQEGGYGRGLTYMQARERLEEHPEQVLPLLLRRLRGMGGAQDEEGRMQMLMTGFSSLGTNLSTRQARGLANLSEEQIARFTQPGGDREFAEYLASQRTQVGGGFGVSEIEAAHEEHRAGIGDTIGDDYRRIRSTEMEVVQQLLPPVVDLMRQITDVGRSLYDAFHEGGPGGLLRHLASVAAPSVAPIIADARRTVDQATSSTDAMGTTMATGTMTALAATGNPIAASLVPILIAQMRDSQMGSLIADLIVEGVRQAVRRGLNFE